MHQSLVPEGEAGCLGFYPVIPTKVALSALLDDVAQWLFAMPVPQIMLACTCAGR